MATVELRPGRYLVWTSIATRDDSTVYAQNPGGNSQAPKGSTITLWVL